MIDFDNQTVRLIKYIRRQKNATATLTDIQLYSDKATRKKEDISFLLICLVQEGYLLAIQKGDCVRFEEKPYITSPYTRFWVTPRGRKLVEDRFSDFWRFMIPTLISVAALIISAFK